MSKNAKLCVSVVCLDENGKVLVVFEKQDGKDVLNVPSGHIEVGETPQNAAHRELLEETGYTAEDLLFVGVTELVTPTGQTYCTFVYLGVIDSHTPREEINDDDVITAQWIKYREVRDKCSDIYRNPLVYKKIEMARYFKRAMENPFEGIGLQFIGVGGPWEKKSRSNSHKHL